MVIKTKARDRVEAEEVLDEVYQLDDLIPLRLVVDIGISSNLLFASREVDVIDLSHQCSMTIIEDTEYEQEKDEFEDDVQYKSFEKAQNFWIN